MTCTQEFTIINKMGMHARPAAQFVKHANRHQCDVWVEKDDGTRVVIGEASALA